MPMTLGALTTFEAWTASTLNAVVKNWYADKIYDQLNREVFMLAHFEKAVVDWNGKMCHVPVKVGRNTGVGWRAESGGLPAATNQVYADLQIPAKYVYGRFQVTGQSIAAANRGGENSFISALGDEMDGLIDDVRNELDQNCFSGGRCVGFLNQHQVGAGAAPDVWDFTGDTAKVQALLTAKGANLNATYVRMDTYAIIGAAEVALDIAAVTATGTISLQAALDTSGVAAGYAIAVIISDNAATLTDLGPNTTQFNSNQMTGIFGNLTEPTIWSVDRTDATATNAALKSTILTMADSLTHERTGLTPTRMQVCFDEVETLGGGKIDMLVLAPALRSEYAALMNQTASLNTVTDKAKKGDVGFDGFAFNGLPLNAARHCPKGLVLYMESKTWRIYELSKAEFEDRDGSILSRVSGQDAHEGFYKWYCQLVCHHPNRNGILVGIDFPGAA